MMLQTSISWLQLLAAIEASLREKRRRCQQNRLQKAAAFCKRNFGWLAAEKEVEGEKEEEGR